MKKLFTTLLLTTLLGFFCIQSYAATYTAESQMVDQQNEPTILILKYFVTESIAAGTAVQSNIHTLTLPAMARCGKILGYSVNSATSTNFDISIRTKAGALSNTYREYEIIDKDTTNLTYLRDDMNLPYCNEDSPATSNLYLRLQNDDTGQATTYVTPTFYIIPSY